MPIVTTADRTDRLTELRERLQAADAATETARLAYVEATRDDPESVRDARRAWDHARAARNEIESLILMQEAGAHRSAT